MSGNTGGTSVEADVKLSKLAVAAKMVVVGDRMAADRRSLEESRKRRDACLRLSQQICEPQ